MKHLSSFTKCSALFVLLMLANLSFALAQPNAKIENAFAAGDAAELALLFNSTVEIRILDEENVYAKQQAAVVLDTFFRKYPPSSFSVQHRNNRDNNSFIIGTLQCQSDTFRISIFLKDSNATQKITQISISKAANF